MDLVRMLEVCLRIDFTGEETSLLVFCWALIGEMLRFYSFSFFITWLFLTTSTGTGLIRTFELFLLEEYSIYLLRLLGGPQLINLDDWMISGAFVGEDSTFSLNLRSRFFTPLFFIIFSMSSSCFCFLRASYSNWEDLFFLLLLARLAMIELSRLLQTSPSDWFKPESFLRSEIEESEWSRWTSAC